MKIFIIFLLSIISRGVILFIYKLYIYKKKEIYSDYFYNQYSNNIDDEKIYYLKTYIYILINQ